MYKELNIYNQELSEEDAKTLLFEAINMQLGGICCSPYFIPLFHNLLPNGMILATPIDFPIGCSDMKIKNHAIIHAIRKGANAVDIICNADFIRNNRFISLKKDLESHINLCKEKCVSLRIMLEYRKLTEKGIQSLLSILTDLNIEYVFPSTGFFLDNYSDNLIVAKNIGKKYNKLNIITNGNIWKYEQYKTIKESNVFGVRFNSIYAVKNCLSKV